MTALDERIGLTTAYGYAKLKGYTGTEEQFAQALANAGITLEQIENAIDGFVNTTVPNAVQSVTDEGTTQVGNVNTAGTTQVGAVNTAGSNQIAAIQAKGEETKQSIPADFPTGNYPDMSVGEVFSDDSYTEDKTPYLYRVSGGGVEVGKVEADQIVGGTIAWNQLLPIPSSDKSTTVAQIAVTDNRDGSYTLNGTANSANANVWLFGTFQSAMANYTLQNAHKYLTMGVRLYASSDNTGTLTHTSSNVLCNGARMTSVSGDFKGSGIRMGDFVNGTQYSNLKIYPMIFDLTQMFGSAVADYIYALEQATSGAGVAFFKKLFPKPYYAYDAGTLMHVSGLVSHDLIGFNAFDPETGKAKLVGGQVYQITGTYTALSLDGNTVTPDASGYFTPDASGELSVTGGADDTCVHLVWDGERDGEYEEYEVHSYPLDNSLTLRGIPKLDSSNNLYYDGDVYSSDGKVQRKYGIVDLGTVNWDLETNGFVGALRTIKPDIVNQTLICSKYPLSTATKASMPDKTIRCNSTSTGDVFVKDSDYTDTATFKTAMNGVMLVYELATPTEETAEPYTEYQKVSKYGTEEYVSTGIVPVGHVTKYPVDIVAKVDGLPSDFSTLIAPTEKGFTATRAYTANQFLIVNNQLYRVTATIASGATITPNTNVTAVTVADILTSLLNA